MANQKIQHFSHQHSLSPLKLQGTNTINCNACQRRISDPFHACSACQFYLHDECLNAPRSLNHPSHHLTLLPFPTYTSRSFNCDCCGLNATNAFTYSCSQCNFDLHTHCALSPQTLILAKHPHELQQLIYDSANICKNVIFICDICHLEADLNHWVYHCGDCDFGTHLHCALPDRWPLKLDKPAANMEAVDVGIDEMAIARDPPGQEVDHMSLAIDEVMEIQIMLARLQNKLSKANKTATSKL